MLERGSEEHTSELQSRQYLVCRLLLEKKPDTLRIDPIGGLPLPTWLDRVRERLCIWPHDRRDELGKIALSLTGQALLFFFKGRGAPVIPLLFPTRAFSF